jgi:hypothetical protein
MRSIVAHVNRAPTRRLDAAVVEQLSAAAEPWVAYVALVDLMGADPNAAHARAAYERLCRDPLIGELVSSLDVWPGPPLSRAYDPKDALWKLSMLADFGLGGDDPRIARLAERLFVAQSETGGFLHGGFDHTRTWDQQPYICIDHVQTAALARFGYTDDPRLERAYAHILSWQRLDGGWHPNAQTLPGAPRQAEPSCPFGTLNVLRALVAHPEHRGSPTASAAAEFLLDCWQRRDEPYRPVGFGIGATWDKLQYPFVQYQRLKTLDTLSQVPTVHADARFKAMLDQLMEKRRPDGFWAAESVNKPYAAFDFGQKKGPSAWITLVALRVLSRSRMPGYAA